MRFKCKCGRTYNNIRVFPLMCGCGTTNLITDNQLPEIEQAAPASAANKPITLGKKAKTLTAATIKWIEAGRPYRNAEQQREIKVICSTCPFFSGYTCKKCGCFLPAKISMATEHCPLDPPKW